MAEPVCSCGYKPQFPQEFDMLDRWGCAKARVTSPGGFGVNVTMCSATGEPPEDTQLDPSAVQEKYKEMLEQKK